MLMVANTDTLRQQSRAMVLTALRKAGAASHTEIAKLARMSSATVSAITADLEQELAIKRLEPTRTSGRGRPRVLFQLNESAAFLAIVRITAHSVEYSLADYAGTIKDRFSESRPTKDDTVEEFVSRLNTGLERLIARAQLSPDHIEAISITSKGVVSSGLPILLWSPVFGDQKIDFGSVLQSKWQAPVQLTNETRFVAQAYAKKTRQALGIAKPRKVAVISLGNSIGMGICTEDVHGRVESIAPSFSHMVHRTDGPLCQCGERGCVEAFSGFYGMLRTAMEAPENSIPVSQVPLDTLDKIANDARSGNLHAEYALRTAAEAIGVGLSRVLSLFGEMKVVITGPGVRYLDLMQPTIETHMRKNLYLRNRDGFNLAIETDESGLVYDGNLDACLSNLDRNVLAMGSRKKVVSDQ